MIFRTQITLFTFYKAVYPSHNKNMNYLRACFACGIYDFTQAIIRSCNVT